MTAPRKRRRSWTFRLVVAGLIAFPLGFLLVVLTVALGFGPGAPLGALLLLGSTLLLTFLALRWLARRVFHRVGRRLLVSYLLVGVVPPLLLSGFVLVILYVLAGQLAALRVEAALEEQVQALQTWVETLDPGRLEPGVLPEVPPALAGAGTATGVVWRAGGTTGSAGSEGLADLAVAASLPETAEASRRAGFGRMSDGTVVLFAVAEGNRGIALAVQQLEPAVRRAVEETTGVAVVFPQARAIEGDVNINFDGRRLRTITDADSSAGGEVVAANEDLFEDSAAPPGGRGPLAATWVFWGRLASLPWVELPSLEPIRDRDESGNEEEADEAAGVAVTGATDATDEPSRSSVGLLLLTRTSISREYYALFGGQRAVGANEEIGEVALVVMRALLAVTLVLSAPIALIAAFLVQRVAVATARLSRGFDQVQRGNFDARAKMRGHDQLAELVAGFNRMVSSLQTSIAERADREAIERELALAHDLQRRLLPGVDASFAGFDVAAYFDPAAAVGGDLYQFWSDDSGALRVVVGDVSGHGLATGIVMAASTALVWAQAREARDAGALFGALDRQIRGITEARTFLTLQHCRLDTAARRAELTNAGHPYPFRVDETGRVSTVESPSRPLGVSLPAAEFSTQEAPLEPGDLWCFYSDGIVEATGTDGEPFGFERLRAALGRCAGLAAAEAREHFLAEWRGFVGEAEPDDDRTLILVCVKGTSGAPATGGGAAEPLEPEREQGAAGPASQ
jgi:serine phosphatase RsbU (regulator of sigma subunit)